MLKVAEVYEKQVKIMKERPDGSDYINFEKEFYPKIIKKHKSNFESIRGFWHSIDNIKDINILNQNENIKKYRYIKKIQKKLKSNEKKFLEK